ncbi:hypothetical protein ANN_04183 [Periplaneta americana]|uniref:Uncharacterized protein n=1 Tax=Periplaneta americana TaxID=6978 RepID=A0ABQ8T9R2_PERAM|nr:hypothetical protein ANN_04183 [Periplaneta americana]
MMYSYPKLIAHYSTYSVTYSQRSGAKETGNMIEIQSDVSELAQHVALRDSHSEDRGLATLIISKFRIRDTLATSVQYDCLVLTVADNVRLSQASPLVTQGVFGRFNLPLFHLTLHCGRGEKNHESQTRHLTSADLPGHVFTMAQGYRRDIAGQSQDNGQTPSPLAFYLPYFLQPHNDDDANDNDGDGDDDSHRRSSGGRRVCLPIRTLFLPSTADSSTDLPWLSCLMSDALLVSLVRFKPALLQLTKQQQPSVISRIHEALDFHGDNPVSNPEKYTGRQILKEATLRKKYVQHAYEKCLREVKCKLQNEKISVSIDESMVSVGRHVANVVVAALSAECCCRPYLLMSEVLERLGDQNKSWCPHKVCRGRVEELRSWKNGKRKSLPFGIPMIWREPTNHGDDCYFCTVKVAGYTAKNNKDILYPNILSAIRPVPHGPDISVPLPPESDTLPSASSRTETESPVDHTYEPDNSGEDRCFNQSEFNDLVRDLTFPKESAELLDSRLKEKKVLAEGTYFSWYRHREKELVPFFAEEENLSPIINPWHLRERRIGIHLHGLAQESCWGGGGLKVSSMSKQSLAHTEPLTSKPQKEARTCWCHEFAIGLYLLAILLPCLCIHETSRPGWQVGIALAFFAQGCGFDSGLGRWELSVLKCDSLMSVDLLACKRTPAGQNSGTSGDADITSAVASVVK